MQYSSSRTHLPTRNTLRVPTGSPSSGTPNAKSPNHPPTSTALALDNQLCFALYSASLAMTKLYKPVLAPMGLTYPQYLTLLALWERDGQGVSELGERLFLDSGTLTPLLKRMEAGGWLLRQRSTEDERRVIVRLTAQGQALRDKARSVRHSLAGRTGLDNPQIAQFTEGLQILRARLLEPPPSHSSASSASP